MSSNAVFNKVSPIGDTDTDALPIRSVGPAIGYYTQVLGFSLVSKEKDRAVLQRDEAKIGLAVNGQDPLQASCYFSVSDVEALRAELEAKGIEPSPLRVDGYGGKKYRVFFAQEPFGVCFCFGQQVEDA
jgi:lactoylglutathione lyase